MVAHSPAVSFAQAGALESALSPRALVHFAPAPRRATASSSCSGALLAIAARRGSWNEDDARRRRRPRGGCGSPRRAASPRSCWQPLVNAALPTDGAGAAPVLTPDKRSKRRSRRAKPMPVAQAYEQTLMLRFLPIKLTPDELLAEFEAFLPFIDFYYLPTNFETKNNLGYAFLNFVDREAARRFAVFWDASGVPEEPGSVTDARVQGFAANVERFRSSSVMAVLTADRKPRIFFRGVQQPFPDADQQLPPVGPRFRPTGGDEPSGSRARSSTAELVPSFLRPHSESAASEDLPVLPVGLTA